MAYRIYKKGQNWLHWQWILWFALIVFLFGLLSVFLAFPPKNVFDVLHNLFRTLQLFLPERIMLEVPPGAWHLMMAKIFGAITFILVIAQVIFQLFINQYQLRRLRQKKNHIVITGFGACGQQLASAILAQRREVVAIDLQPSEQQQDFAMQNKRLTLLAGDIAEPAVLAYAAAHQANRVIFASNDDLANIQGAIHLRQLMKNHKIQRPIIAHIQIHDPNLVQSLKDYPRFIREDNKLGFQAVGFNMHRAAARRLLLAYPLYHYAELRGQDRVRVAIFGFGQMAQQLALQLALSAHYRDFKPPHIIVVDPEASRLGQDFLSRYPGLHQPEVTGTINFIDFDIHAHALDVPNKSVLEAFALRAENCGSPSFLQALEMQGQKESAYGQSLTAMVVCYEADHSNVTAALRLRTKSQQSRWALAPIFVWMTQDTLQELSVPAQETAHFDQVVQHFGTVEQICTWQEVVEGSSDSLAKFLHEAYSARNDNEQAVPWTELAETFRDANRSAADHLAVKLASVGYWVSDNPTHWSTQVELTADPATKELLAELEHRRWCAERRLNGWQYGPKRDNTRKIHPSLISFERLSEAEKDKDRDNINDLQSYFSPEEKGLNTAFLALRRKFMGGTQKVRKAISIGLIAAQNLSGEQTSLFGKKGLLPRLFSDYSLHHITIISALQTPLEMQFAQAGLEQFANQAGRLINPRAYPYESTEQQTLSEQADWVIDLLPAGQAVNDLELTEAAPQRQLQRAQVYILERADIVILVGEDEQTRQWSEWRQGKTLIPVELSSLPPSLRGKRQIPRAGFIVEPTTQNVQELS